MKEYFESEKKKTKNKVRLKSNKLKMKLLNIQKQINLHTKNKKFNNEVVKQLAEYHNIKVSDILD